MHPSLRRSVVLLSVSFLGLTGAAIGVAPTRLGVSHPLRTEIAATRLAGLLPNAAEVFTGTGQVSVRGQVLVARFATQPSFTAGERDGALVLTVSMGPDSYGGLLAIPYSITTDGFETGPRHVIVRYCWSSCLVMTDTTVVVK